MNDVKVARFWDNFITKSVGYGIKDDAVRWYVRHAEGYIKAHEGLRLTDHTPQLVDDYLSQISRQPRLKDWQYKQIIKSLQILFVELVQSDWAKTYPWHDRMESATSLPADHATIARDRSAPHPQPQRDAPHQHAPATSDSLLKKTSAAFPQAFERLITEIRMRHYSIRTEKAYTEWLARFILFTSMQNPITMEPQAIATYLEHLVVNRNVASSTQSQALNALLFFYKQVLGHEVADIGIFRHATKPRKLPVVLTRNEVDDLRGLQRKPASRDHTLSRHLIERLHDIGVFGRRIHLRTGRKREQADEVGVRQPLDESLGRHGHAP